MITIENLTQRHIDAVQRYAEANRKHTLLQTCKRAARRNRGEPNLGALRDVAEAYNKLAGGGHLGVEHFSQEPAPTKLNLDEIDHMAALSPGGGPIQRALVRRIRELEAKCRATGEALASFVGEDEDEERELAVLSAELIAVADAGTVR